MMIGREKRRCHAAAADGFALDVHLDVTGGVAYPPCQLEAQRQPVHERAEADALHDAANRDPYR